jgi:hypothetical protein
MLLHVALDVYMKLHEAKIEPEYKRKYLTLCTWPPHSDVGCNWHVVITSQRFANRPEERYSPAKHILALTASFARYVLPERIRSIIPLTH